MKRDTLSSIRIVTLFGVCSIGVVGSLINALDIRTEALRAAQAEKLNTLFAQSQRQIGGVLLRHNWSPELRARWKQDNPAPLLPRPDFTTDNVERFRLSQV